MNDSIAKFEISKEVLEPILKQHIQTAIVQTLGNNEQKGKLLDAVILATLDQKVDYQGRISNSSYENKYPFIETLVRQLVMDAAKEACRKWVENKKPQIIASLEKQLMKNKNRMANEMIESLIDTAHGRLNIKLEINGKKEY